MYHGHLKNGKQASEILKPHYVMNHGLIMHNYVHVFTPKKIGESNSTIDHDFAKKNATMMIPSSDISNKIIVTSLVMTNSLLLKMARFLSFLIP